MLYQQRNDRALPHQHGQMKYLHHGVQQLGPAHDPFMKLCTSCRTTKRTDDFYANPASSDGLQSRCTDCAREAEAERNRIDGTVSRAEYRPYTDDWFEDGRRCTKCRVVKPWEDFATRATGKNGRESQCRQCQSQKRRADRAADPYRYRAADRKRELMTGRSFVRRYGITREQYEQMARRQKAACAVCGVVPKRLVIDHDHQTGRVRELLCDRCNHALHGVEKEDLLPRLLAYVARHGGGDLLGELIGDLVSELLCDRCDHALHQVMKEGLLPRLLAYARRHGGGNP